MEKSEKIERQMMQYCLSTCINVFIFNVYPLIVILLSSFQIKIILRLKEAKLLQKLSLHGNIVECKDVILERGPFILFVFISLHGNIVECKDVILERGPFILFVFISLHGNVLAERKDAILEREVHSLDVGAPECLITLA